MIPENIIQYHSIKHKIPLDKTRALFYEVENFLSDVINKRRSVPTKEIDEAWHTFILHTKFYADYCLKTFGTFIHHNPHRLLFNNCSAGGGPQEEEEVENNCDAAFINKQASSGCDGNGGNDGEGGNEGNNLCDAQYFPKLTIDNFEYIR